MKLEILFLSLLMISSAFAISVGMNDNTKPLISLVKSTVSSCTCSSNGSYLPIVVGVLYWDSNNSKLNSQNIQASGNVNVGSLQTNSFQLGTSTTPGYVLKADASGNGTWQASSSSVNLTGIQDNMTAMNTTLNNAVLNNTNNNYNLNGITLLNQTVIQVIGTGNNFGTYSGTDSIYNYFVVGDGNTINQTFGLSTNFNMIFGKLNSILTNGNTRVGQNWIFGRSNKINYTGTSAVSSQNDFIIGTFNQVNCKSNQDIENIIIGKHIILNSISSGFSKNNIILSSSSANDFVTDGVGNTIIGSANTYGSNNVVVGSLNNINASSSIIIGNSITTNNSDVIELGINNIAINISSTQVAILSNITAPNICYSNGVNCTVVNSSYAPASNVSILNTGLNMTYKIVCDVDLVGLTKKYQNFTYNKGVLIYNSTCT